MSQAQLSADLLDECRALALRLAPELAAAPLYVTDLPADYPDAGDTLAFANRNGFDFAIRRHLLDQSRWAGPGTVIAFCQPMTDHEALGLLLHEAAHVVPFQAPPADFEPSEEFQAAQRLLVARKLIEPTGDVPTMPTWYAAHGLKFVRRCLHLHARAWSLGHEIGLPAIHFAGPEYDMAAPWRYRRTLGDEPQRMATATFSEIDSTPMPKAFRDLFHSDFQDWCDRTGKEPSHVHAA